ncbi:MAG: carboxypeptidase-like regulatory domain-containing protein, partial [Candidatus Sulfotelmatobacter sp.]
MKWHSLAPNTPYRFRVPIVSLAAFVLLLCCSGWAQTASISGVVTDPTGAVISSATVVAENSGHSWSKQCTTGEDGSFSLPVPAPGHYQLRIEAPGFKQYVQDDLVIDQATAVALNVRLVLISESTTVE